MWPDGDECAKLGHLVHGEEEDRRDGHPSGRAIPRKSLILLVRMKGLEPSHPCEYMDLNHARLPIPPHPHVCTTGSKLYLFKPRTRSQPFAIPAAPCGRGTSLNDVDAHAARRPAHRAHGRFQLEAVQVRHLDLGDLFDLSLGDLADLRLMRFSRALRQI